MQPQDEISLRDILSSGRSSVRVSIKRKDDLEAFKQELNIDDHLLSLGEIARRYKTDLTNGLVEEIAEELLRINGPNAIKPAALKSRWTILAMHLFGGFAALLWIGVILSLIGFSISYVRDPDDTRFDQVYLASVIFGVIMGTGFFGFYQESQSRSIAKAFSKLMPKSAKAIRSGRKKIMNTEDLVIGDIVILESGYCIPADVRIIETIGLKVDNSSITGESDPQPRGVDMSDLNPIETCNLAFYGTNIIEGEGKGLVIACGDDTLMGHIAKLTSGLESDTTPIKVELARFIRIITMVALGSGSSFFIISVVLGYSYFDSFLYFIAIVVANVPEGLLVTVTACLTLTAKKMSSKNCLCKNMHAIETLGCTTVICSDKTGTLTQNKMTISHMYYDGAIIDVLSDTYTKTSSQGLNNLCMVGILCSRASFNANQEEISIIKREVSGDASEVAVLKWMEIVTGRQTQMIRSLHPKIFEIPFNSSNKYQLSIHRIPDQERLYLVMKGAPERIIDRCSVMTINGEIEQLTESNRKKLKVALLEISYMGERVLGFADLLLPKEFTPDHPFSMENIDFPTVGLRFVGFMSMIDPPRPGVSSAVAKCKTAGIKVIMVTGDHPITAMAIAKKVGIISTDSETVFDIAMRKNISASKVTESEAAQCRATVVTGNDLREMDSAELDAIIGNYDEIVFARTSPQQKLLIVEAFQRAKNIVGVTGDGVNDSPALKKADIGIAMGISGSDVSKEASDIIILDDNFASIAIGIEEGRLIFDNLKKSIAYLLTSNVPEMAPFLLFVLINIPLPLSIMAILIIDVGTDLWPAISFAYEKSEADIMCRSPRDRNSDRLVSMKLIYFANLNIGILQAFAGLTCYFYVFSEYGFLPDRLVGIRSEWYSEKNDVEDSYGQEWSKEERLRLECRGYSTYFLAIVLTQVADCIITKTRRISVIQQGMANVVMNFGLIFEIIISLIIVYCPYVNTVFNFEPIEFYILAPALPYMILMVLFDETRKYLIRRRPGGWFDRETYI